MKCWRRYAVALFFCAVFYIPALSQNCAEKMTLRQRLTGPQAGAHQGGIFHFNPNTLQRFESARKDGADIIEMDLRLSKDGIVFVFHDKDMHFLTNCKGVFEQKTSEEIDNCRIRFSGQPIARFEDVLKWDQGRVIINAEFKDLEVIVPAISLVQKYDAYEWVFFQAKGDPQRYFIARQFDQRVALLFAPNDKEALFWALGLNDGNLLVIEIHQNLRKPEYINAIHASNKFVLEDAWHLSFSREVVCAKCAEAYQLGIDIAISNRPKACARQKIRRIMIYIIQAQKPNQGGSP